MASVASPNAVPGDPRAIILVAALTFVAARENGWLPPFVEVVVFINLLRPFGAVARSLACRYEWAKDGFGDLLMMALPHHLDTMGGTNGEDGAFLMKDSYQSIKVKEERGSRSVIMVSSKACARI